MLTIDALRDMGVQPEDGLQRCLNDENFYLNLVKMVPGDAGFANLQDALSKGDLEAGFEAAHALKGVLGNLSLTPSTIRCMRSQSCCAAAQRRITRPC